MFMGKGISAVVLQQKSIEKQQSEAPDEDGWILVTRHGKSKGATRAQAQKASEKQAAAKRKVRHTKYLLYSSITIDPHFMQL